LLRVGVDHPKKATPKNWQSPKLVLVDRLQEDSAPELRLGLAGGNSRYQSLPE
jgi:hypothetical protein